MASKRQRQQIRKDRICLALAVLIVALSVLYWSAYSVNAYRTLHSYWDLATPAYDMYYHVNYPGVVHGLQYLSFAEHLAPDQLLVLPIFYANQSSLTLLLVQAAVLSLTGLLVFFVAKRLLKDSFIGLLLCFAYLINPGMHGMLLIDYHVEFLIIPFVLLTFYFFMGRKRIPFLVSLLLLLGTLETAAFVAIAMGIGFLAYELIYDGKEKKAVRSERMRLSVFMIVISILALAAYLFAASLLSSAYAAGAYPNLPPPLETVGLASQQIGALGSMAINTVGHLWAPPIYIAYALAVVFLGFGIGALFIPEVTLILVLPWLVEGYFLGKSPFFLLWYQYFGYVVGGSLVAAILAVIAIRRRSSRFGSFWDDDPNDMIRKSILVMSLVIFMMCPIFTISNALTNPAQNFLFRTPPWEAQHIAQVESMIRLIPQNASVVATVDTVSQLTDRQELAPMSGTGKSPWFTPEYVLVELNGSIGTPPDPESSFNATALDNSVLSSGDYRLYARNGGAELYKLS
jgi:uncharacterized membrane protein